MDTTNICSAIDSCIARYERHMERYLPRHERGLKICERIWWKLQSLYTVRPVDHARIARLAERGIRVSSLSNLKTHKKLFMGHRRTR